MQSNTWGGAWAAIPTPFCSDGTVDRLALVRHIAFLCDNQIDGIVACGTTGEAATMTDAEKCSVWEAVLEASRGRVPVIAGVGTNDTRTTLMNAKMAQTCGVDGLLIVTPYYNKPNQEGQYRHFMTIADAVDLPQILYTVPGRTGCRCQPETLGRLSTHPNIVGVKDATGDMIAATQTMLATRGQSFRMFSGDDGTTMPFVALGGVGAISVVANIAPKLMHDLIEHTQLGHLEAARTLHERMMPLYFALFSDTSPIPLKAMLTRTALNYPGSLRSPLFAMEAPAAEALCAPVQEFLKELS